MVALATCSWIWHFQPVSKQEHSRPESAAACGTTISHGQHFVICCISGFANAQPVFVKETFYSTLRVSKWCELLRQIQPTVNPQL